ncbi:GGDEF domain-containing protein [uncultured Sphaerotilus sp.]|uniref:GGDEF domain-containing protein n=1 Tax=uncultured Sphaerotilus sp. TaxID=474984 RepID=UPI0030CA4408
MKYHDSMERSADVLRQALQLMKRHGSALHPVNYTLWYEYVRGENTALRTAMDRYLGQHLQLDEAVADAMYRRFVSGGGIDATLIERTAESVSTVLTGMAESAARAGDQTAQYGTSLSRLSHELAGSAHSPALEEVLNTTRQMQIAVTEMQQRLSDSQNEISQLRAELRRVHEESRIDSLTGLANRRAFDQRLNTCIGEAETPAKRYQRPSLLIADIDHFKRINDTHGHPYGDHVLRAIGSILKETTPEDCLAARIGGEEFAVLIPSRSLSEARALAETVRTRVAGARVSRQGQGQDAEVTRVTISIGLTLFRPGENGTAFMERADQALYASKDSGRDRVTVLAG